MGAHGTGRRGFATALIMAFLALPTVAAPQEGQLIATGSAVDKVLMYSDRAMVIRKAVVEIPEGRSHVVFEDLPDSAVDSSVAVALENGAADAVKVANIQIEPIHKTTFRKEEAREAMAELATLQRRLRALRDERQAVMDQTAFAKDIRIGARPPKKDGQPDMAPLAPEAWDKVLDYMAETFRETAERERDLAEEIDHLTAEVAVATSKANLLLSYKTRTTKRVLLEIVADKPCKTALLLSYRIPNAAWFPRYDVRADLNAGTIEITGYGLVRQESGEDWTNVALRFSAAEPARAADLPELKSWRIKPDEPQVRVAGNAERPVRRGFAVTKMAESNLRQVADKPQDVTYHWKANGQAAPGNGAAAFAFDAASSVDARRDELLALDLKQQVANVQGEAQALNRDTAAKGIGLGAQVRTERRLAEIQKLQLQQQEARDKGEWERFREYNGLLIANSYYFDRKAHENPMQSLILLAGKNVELAERQIASRKLAGGLVPPVRSSGGYDYRWDAVRREDVPSDGALTKVVLFRHTLPAEFVYEVAPELSKVAYLRGKSTNDSSSPFLAGPVSVFLGPDFAGESALGTCSPSETFTLGLGADEQIAVTRQAESHRDTSGLFSKAFRFSNSVTVTVRNNKRKAVTLAVIERAPYTTDENLTLSGITYAWQPARTYAFNKHIALMRWQFDLEPGTKSEVEYTYWYQHPTDRVVLAEDNPAEQW